jgi:hypothetical protein
VTIPLDPGRKAEALDRARALEEEAAELRRQAHVKERTAESIRQRWQEPASARLEPGEFPGPLR